MQTEAGKMHVHFPYTSVFRQKHLYERESQSKTFKRLYKCDYVVYGAVIWACFNSVFVLVTCK